MEDTADRWSRWLLHDRFGGDAESHREMMRFLEQIRDRVLEAAGIAPGNTVVDVGCGDGLLGFGAFPLVGETGRVSFSDVSEKLLDECREIADEIGVRDRCQFIEAAAETLDGLEDGSVDVAMTRSVLIYVEDKRSAFAAFHRILKPGGRISLFEPINRRMVQLNRGTFLGFEASPIEDLVEKIRGAFGAGSPDDGPMMGFDETDLFRFAEDAGFINVTVNLELRSIDRPVVAGVGWSTLLATSPNPLAPTLGEAIEQALTPEEAARFEAYLRPLVDEGTRGRDRKAVAFVTGDKVS